MAGDIADVVALLNGPDARRFTRQTINATGGRAELRGRSSSGRGAELAQLGGAAEP